MTFGIDVVILATIGSACVLVTLMLCIDRATRDAGKFACLAVIATVVVMLVSYVIMVRVLDSYVGIYW